MSNFIQNLIYSGYKLGITEVGVGVPLSHAILDVAGASNVLMFSEIPYNKVFQPPEARAVSSEVSEYYAQTNYNKLVDNGIENPVGIGITGAIKLSKERGSSHLWISICSDNYNRTAHYALYCTDDTRIGFIQSAFEAIKSFLVINLLKEEHCCAASSHIMDAYYGTKVDVYETAYELAEDYIPTVITSDGRMQRAIDYVRKSSIYRGSFNPPTKAHQHILNSVTDSLPEISIENVDKPNPGRAEIIHRMKMLNALGYPVMLTSFTTFSVFSAFFKKRQVEKIEFIVGDDTYLRIIRDKDRDPMFDVLESDYFVIASNSAEFMLHKNHKKSRSISMVDTQVRATEFRDTKDHNLLPESVSKYIQDNKLYV